MTIMIPGTASSPTNLVLPRRRCERCGGWLSAAATQRGELAHKTGRCAERAKDRDRDPLVPISVKIPRSLAADLEQGRKKVRRGQPERTLTEEITRRLRRGR